MTRRGLGAAKGSEENMRSATIVAVLIIILVVFLVLRTYK